MAIRFYIPPTSGIAALREEIAAQREENTAQREENTAQREEIASLKRKRDVCDGDGSSKRKR